jgi:hypothetical protein
MAAYMIFTRLMSRAAASRVALVVGALALAACASEEVDDVTGSRLQQPVLAQGEKPPLPIEAGDIAIAAQLFSHDIRQLPQIDSLTVPQLAQFTGVTSIVRDHNGQLAQVDTQPYTDLLRDRLLLGDREKLRFVERELPAYQPPTTHRHKESPAPSEIDNGDADYRVLAELRGYGDSSSLRIQMEFVDAHTGAVLLNEVYRIRREAPGSGSTEAVSDQDVPSGPPPAQQDSSVPPADSGVPPVPDTDDESTAPSLPTHYNPPPPPQ